MTEQAGGPVLILEDEALQAADLALVVEAMGLRVAGPYATPEDGLSAIAEERPRCALLDVELAGGRTCLPVADALAEAEVPFAFITGRETALPKWLDQHGDRLLLPKPFRPSQVATLLERLGA